MFLHRVFLYYKIPGLLAGRHTQIKAQVEFAGDLLGNPAILYTGIENVTGINLRPARRKNFLTRLCARDLRSIAW